MHLFVGVFFLVYICTILIIKTNKMNLTEKEFEKEIRRNVYPMPLPPRSMRNIVNVLKNNGVEFKQVPQKPEAKDYDFNDVYEVLKYMTNLEYYTNYLETKI